MRLSAIRVLAGTLLCVLLALPADAMIIIQHNTANALTYCTASNLFSAASTDAPALVAASFSGEGKRVAFRTCRDGDGNTHYFIRAPRPNRNGICRVFEHEVFPGTENDSAIVQVLYSGMEPGWEVTIRRWKMWPPDEWTLMHYSRQSAVLGFVTGQACPLGDDPRYIGLENVSDGMLTSFQSKWEAVTRTPTALEEAFAGVPTVTAFSGAIDAQPSARLRENLRRSVFERHRKVESISCHEGGCTAWLDSVSVDFDVTPSGIAFKALKAVWQA